MADNPSPAENLAPANDPISSATGDTNYSHIGAARSRFFLASLFVLASPFLIDAPCIAILNGIRAFDSVPFFIVIGIMVAKFGLLTMWLAWGSSRAIFRMLILALSWLFTCLLVPGPSSDIPESFAALYLLMIVSSALLAVPRLFGIRWITQPGASAQTAAHKKYQFSIFDLLIWTTTTAYLSWLVGTLGLPHGLDTDIIFIVLICCGILVVGTLTAMWAQLAELAVGPSLVARSMIAFALAFIIGIVIAALTRAPGNAVGFIFALFFTVAACLIGACYILRRLGNRLVWRKRSRLPLPSA